MLHNIIRNALIHGNRTFHAVAQSSEEGVLISIRNDYTADPLDIDIERVFDRFYMADQARTKDSTGLGLSIAKELVEKMNGRIWPRWKKGSLLSRFSCQVIPDSLLVSIS